MRYNILVIFEKKNRKMMMVSCLVITIILLLIAGIVTITPKYLESRQMERDTSTKCKSYRALEQIAASIYKNNPNGSDWIIKSTEAETRRKQYKCSQVIIN